MDRNDESDVDRMITERLSAFRAHRDWQPDLEHGVTILRQRRKAMKERRRRLAILATAAAACVLMMAFPVTRTFAERWISACVRDTAAVRQFLLGPRSGAAPSSTYVEPADRRTAPDFRLTDGLGRSVKLSDFRGQVVLLNFWATSWERSQQEIPWFVEFQKINRQRGFAVLGVSMDAGGWAALTPYIREKGIDYPVVIGDEQTAERFGGLQTKPLTLIVDRAGRVAAVHAGLCTKEEYESDIKMILNEN